jgi:hypothetical protein
MACHFPERRIASNVLARSCVDRSDPEDVYESFLAAIEARDIDQVVNQTTETFNICLRRLRRESDFTLQFDLWCASYPTSAHVNSCAVNGVQATLDVDMTVRGECILASITLLRLADGWRVHHEQFFRRRVAGAVAGHAASSSASTTAGGPRFWLDMMRAGRAWPEVHSTAAQD